MPNDKSIILRHVPEQLHRDFKAKCAREGRTIQDQVIRLMVLWIREPDVENIMIIPAREG